MANDWRVEIADYLKNPSQKITRKLRYKLTKYVLLDDQLYYKTVDGVLFKCLSQQEEKVLMGEVHEGICEAHQLAYKMKWVIAAPSFKNKTRYTPYVSPESQISHIAIHKGNIERQCLICNVLSIKNITLDSKQLKDNSNLWVKTPIP